MSRTLAHTLVALVAAAVALASTACGKHIGDGCMTNIDCSLNADRRCDLAQPGGYCTIFMCEPDQCPETSMCIQFEATQPRLMSRACMNTCNHDSDCRGGYRCETNYLHATDSCPPYDADGGAPPPACTRLLDTMRQPGWPVGYCVMAPLTQATTGSDP